MVIVTLIQGIVDLETSLNLMVVPLVHPITNIIVGGYEFACVKRLTTCNKSFNIDQCLCNATLNQQEKEFITMVSGEFEKHLSRILTPL